MKPKIYFDWCAVQNLFERNDKRLVLKIKVDFFIKISSMNIIEAGSTQDFKQRSKFLKFCGELIDPNGRLLDQHGNLLKRSYLAFKSNQKSFDWYSECFNTNSLENPEKYSDDYISKPANQYRKMEDIYLKMNRDIRSDKIMTEILKDESIVGNPINFLKSMFKCNDFLKSIFSKTMETLGVESFDENEAPEVIKNLDEWRYYWSALFLGTYHLAIKPENYSPKKKNAGFRDLIQTIYALACDYFITDDDGFYDVLKCFTNSDFVKKRVNVMKLDEFLVLKYKINAMS